MRQAWRNEKGMALAVAIFALVVVGGLVAGAFFIGTQEQRMGENQRRVQQAFGLAEAGAAEILKGWDPDSFNLRLRPFPADTFHLGRRGLPQPGSGSYGGYVFKLNQNLYLMDIIGTDTSTGRGSATLARRGSGGRQRIGVLTRVRPLLLGTEATLTTQGNVRLAGTSSVDGRDQNPPSWTNCDPITADDTNKAGVRTSATGNVTTTGGGSTVEGEPPVVRDPTLTASDFTVFGDLTYDDLTRMATYVINSGGMIQTKPEATGLVCNKTIPTNWGDGLNRAGPCGNHFPIVWVRGNQLTTINNFQGQGILLVDGDLRIQGMYDFFGVVIVRGSLSTLGTAVSAAHFWGAVMAQNVDLDLQTIGGAANLNYSKCAIMDVLAHTGITSYMRSRGFVTLY